MFSTKDAYLLQMLEGGANPKDANKPLMDLLSCDLAGES